MTQEKSLNKYYQQLDKYIKDCEKGKKEFSLTWARILQTKATKRDFELELLNKEV